MLVLADEAVDRQVAMNRLKPPSSHDLRTVQTWLNGPALGDCYFIGRGQAFWHDEETQPDLFALAQRPDDDLFSRLMYGVLLRMYHLLVGRFYKVRTLYSLILNTGQVISVIFNHVALKCMALQFIL